MYSEKSSIVDSVLDSALKKRIRSARPSLASQYIRGHPGLGENLS